MPRSKIKDAFTLIELLVVIAIIITLLAILMPSMNKALRTALDATCSSNLRQCSLVIFDYAADNLGAVAIRANNYQGAMLYDTNGGPANPGGNWIEDRFVDNGYLPDLGVWSCEFSEVPDIEDPRNTRAWCYGSYTYWPANGTAMPAFGGNRPVPLRLSDAGGSFPVIQDTVSDDRPWKYAKGFKANHTTGNYWIWDAMNNVNPSNVNRRTDEAKDVRGANIATFDGSVTWYAMHEMGIAFIEPNITNRPHYSRWPGDF